MVQYTLKQLVAMGLPPDQVAVIKKAKGDWRRERSHAHGGTDGRPLWSLSFSWNLVCYTAKTAIETAPSPGSGRRPRPPRYGSAQARYREARDRLVPEVP